MKRLTKRQKQCAHPGAYTRENSWNESGVYHCRDCDLGFDWKTIEEMAEKGIKYGVWKKTQDPQESESGK